jgi:hypothetical protein
MPSTDRQRWARVLPTLAWKHPGLPGEWTRVLERNEDAMRPEPLPGYVWLDTQGKRAACVGRAPGWQSFRNQELRLQTHDVAADMQNRDLQMTSFLVAKLRDDLIARLSELSEVKIAA